VSLQPSEQDRSVASTVEVMEGAGPLMHRKLFAVIAAAAAAVAGMLVGSPAQAKQVDYANPQVAWVHNVKASGDHATLIAKYRCWGGNEGTHLWVSLKQGGGITGQTAEQLANEEGTSAIAASWYDSHPEGVVCNGSWQIQHFTVDREMGIPGFHPDPWDELGAGSAFMQFCLFDSRATDDLTQGFGYLYTLVPVKA
jgi:hypothetical protein